MILQCSNIRGGYNSKELGQRQATNDNPLADEVEGSKAIVLVVEKNGAKGAGDFEQIISNGFLPSVGAKGRVGEPSE